MLINEKDQLEFNKLLEGAFKGDKIAQARLKEAVTTDSLAPTMFVNAANVQFVSAYNEYDSIWPKIAEKVLLGHCFDAYRQWWFLAHPGHAARDS